MKRFSLLLCGIISTITQAETVVSLPNQGIVLQYPESVRFSQVLFDTQKQQPRLSAPLISGVFDDSKQAQIDQLKTRVITRLYELSKQRELNEACQALLSFVHNHQFGYRLDLPFDFDEVRLLDENNPLLPGNYTLIAKPSTPDVTVLGLVKNPQKLEHQPTATIRDYLNQVEHLSTANRDYAWLITPDGTISVVGIAYWNRENRTLAPGSLLWVGFSGRGEAIQQLNFDIATLMKSVTSPL